MSYSNANPPKLADPRDGLLRGCCCCCSLRQGVLILSALGFIGALIGVIPGGYGTGTFATVYALQVVINLFVMGFSIVGFLGAYNYREKFTKIYFYFSVVSLIVTILGIVVTAVSISSLLDDGGCLNTQDEEACRTAVQSAFYANGIITLLIELYFLAVIYAFWRQLQDTFSGDNAMYMNDGGHMQGAPTVVIQNGQAQQMGGTYAVAQPVRTVTVMQPMATGTVMQPMMQPMPAGTVMQPVVTNSSMQPVATGTVMQPMVTNASVQPVATNASAPPPAYDDGSYPQLGAQDNSFDPPTK